MNAAEAFAVVDQLLGPYDPQQATPDDPRAREALAVLRQVTTDHEALQRVASAGTAVLDSDCGVASLGELATAIKAAGWGDWTDANPLLTEWLS